MSLNGRRIVITRPEPDAGRLAARLEALGAVPVLAPAIQIAFTDPPELRAALVEPAGWDWIVFTSKHGVEAAFRLVDHLPPARVAAIGPATAGALAARGVTPDVMPTEYVAEAVLEALGDVHGQRVLLPRADIARRALLDGLVARGAEALEIAAYQTQPAARGTPDLTAADAVTFTSSSTVRSFLAEHEVPPNAKIVCIGPITADTAHELGLHVDHVADEYTEDGLVAALVAAFTP